MALKHINNIEFLRQPILYVYGDPQTTAFYKHHPQVSLQPTPPTPSPLKVLFKHPLLHCML